MRLFSFFIAASLLFLSAGWETDFNKAVSKARTENKCILLNFSGSDWCIPCIRTNKEIFDSPEFKAYAQDHLILVNADFPRLKKNQLGKEQAKQNNQLAETYNTQGDFPLTLLLDKNGKIITKWVGYPEKGPEAFVNAVKKLVDARN
jgi:thioredoxin-related protein